MDKNKDEKSAKIVSVIVAFVCIAIAIAAPATQGWQEVGIAQGAGLIQRLTYHFFHANISHIAMNVWTFLSLLFLFDISIKKLTMAYIISCTFPVDTIATLATSYPKLPTVGLSGVIYALLGIVSYDVAKPKEYQASIILSLILGFMFPKINGWIHLYCYVAGLSLATLNRLTHNNNDKRG